MKKNEMRLCDAGVREQEWAQKLVQEGRFPKEVTYKDLLDHGMYDAGRDIIIFTCKAVTFAYKVNRA